MNPIPTKKFRRIDSLCGWAAGLIALITYLLTLEPEVSFWDCPEYVVTAYSLEVGHPPGNSFFSLAGRFFITLGGSARNAALAVNIMSAVFSALTISLLFRSITMIARNAIGTKGSLISPKNAILILGAAASGSLLFAWTDSFWFSAVEAEVYAFASFSTALAVWLMLRWYEKPADRILILISYLTGLAVCVHQLNLLYIPALAILFLYRYNKKRIGIVKLSVTLMLSMMIIASILFGMMAGMLKLGKWAELIAVNRAGMPYNTGLLIYAILLLSSYILSLVCNAWSKRTAAGVWMIIAFALSGFFFWGGNTVIFCILTAISLAIVICFRKTFSLRTLNTISWCGLMIITGASAYLLIPLRATANPPVNTGNPSDIFAFDSYIEREQYGEHPLVKGGTPYSRKMLVEHYDSANKTYSYDIPYTEPGKERFSRIRTSAPKTRHWNGYLSHSDSSANEKTESLGRGYLLRDHKLNFRYTPELDAWFTRLFSRDSFDISCYKDWAGMSVEEMDSIPASEAVDAKGNNVHRMNPSTGKREPIYLPKPTVWQHMRYFGAYQLGYMYFRYLMWNFSGRQNDIHSQGQVDAGNFITGFDTIDSAMLGPQEKLPPELGRENPGHHRYYMIPFLMGIAGIIWLISRGRNGLRLDMFLAVLFVMTGIAIVVYLNQTPCEARERDYSFVGSFYAFSIWVGLAVFPIAGLLRKIRVKEIPATILSTLCGLCAAGLVLAENIPDHNRSKRTSARDFAINILQSLDNDAILFTNGDNLTFPLWYAQEVEGIRRDVRIINLAYLATPWYAESLMIPTAGAASVPMTATADDIIYNAHAFTRVPLPTDTMDALSALRQLYSSQDKRPAFGVGVLRIGMPDGDIHVSLRAHSGGSGSMHLGKLLILDIIATNASLDNPRPIYFIGGLTESDLGPLRGNTVKEAFASKFRNSANIIAKDSLDIDRIYSFFAHKALWGGMDKAIYADRVTIEQVISMRSLMLRTARALFDRGDTARALRLARIAETKLPAATVGFSTSSAGFTTFNEAVTLGSLYYDAGKYLNDSSLMKKGKDILESEMRRSALFVKYTRSLPSSLANTLTNKTSGRVRSFYGTVEAYLKAGGSIREINRMPEMKGIDLSSEKRNYERREALMSLLRGAGNSISLSSMNAAEYDRQPLHTRQNDTAMWSLYQKYVSLGGSEKILSSYKELEKWDTIRARHLHLMKSLR